MKEVDISDLSKEELFELIGRVHELGALHLAEDELETNIRDTEGTDVFEYQNLRSEIYRLRQDIQKVITDPKQIREKQIR